MAALVGRTILRVDGSGERGFIVTYRDSMGAVCKAIVPPQDNHPDFIIASAYQNGTPLPGTPVRKAAEAGIWG